MSHALQATGLRGPRRRVLIIEDNDDGRESLRLLLTICGCVVETAADGSEGVRKGLQTQPDVAIVDIGLPDLDGHLVACRLRLAFGSNILLIAHTAYENDARATKAGFDAWLVKPAKLSDWLRYVGSSTAE